MHGAIWSKMLRVHSSVSQYLHIQRKTKSTLALGFTLDVYACRALGWKFLTCHIGHIGGQPLSDVIFDSSFVKPPGLFPNVSAFHDYFSTDFGLSKDLGVHPPHEFRHHLPDQDSIVFTHADLHPSNILVSTGRNPRVVSIVDWHQSGWYPAYWEYCKARWTSRIGGEWKAEYLPMFLDRHDCYDYFDYFCLCRGV